jgi:hypothetical protein
MARDPLWEDIYRTRPGGHYPGEDVVRFVAAIKHLLVHASRA